MTTKIYTGTAVQGKTSLFSGERVYKSYDPVTGPSGYFIFRSTERPAVFVATGTVVAPFVSMSRAGTKPFLLLHGAQGTEDLSYQSDLRHSAREYVPCVSGGKGEEVLPPAWIRRESDPVPSRPTPEWPLWLLSLRQG